MNVLRTITSPRGWKIVPVHYSHDPDKRGDWVFEEKKKYATPDDFSREMEIDFTSRLGAVAYPNFRVGLHLVTGLVARPGLPLCLCVDFNVSPMVWVVGQVWGGIAHFFDEIRQDPATVEGMVNEFRNRYPSHPADIIVYGDATGKRRGQTAKSDYYLLEMAFRGYVSEPKMRVPVANPYIKERLNAFNRRLLGPDNAPGLFIDRERCPELVKDMQEVVLDKAGSGLHKVSDRKQSYSDRTHASDAAGYWIAREWPVSKERYALLTQNTKPMVYGKILGVR